MARRTLADLPTLDADLSPGLRRVATRSTGRLAPRKSTAQATQRLRGEVTAERGRVKRRSQTISGRAPGVDTADILPGSRVARGEVARSLRAVQAAAVKRQMDAENAADLRKFHPSVRQAIEDELSGRGILGEEVAGAAEALGKAAVVVQTGPTVAGGVGTGTGRRKGGSGIATAMAPGAVKAPIVSRALKDLVNLPAQAVPSLYVPAAGLYEAAMGDTARLKQFGEDIKEHDPVYALATGDFKRAGKLANEHPGFALAEAYGVKGTVGRTAGRVMRSGALGSKAKTAGSTARPDKMGPEGTGLRTKQAYSRDVTQKAVQRANEKRKLKRSRAMADEAARTGDAELARKAAQLDPFRMGDHEVRHRMDARVGASHAMARHNRAEIMNEARHAVSGTERLTGTPSERRAKLARNRTAKSKPTAATTLHIQNITDASVADLRAYRREVAAEHDQLPPAQKAANAELLAELDKALASDPRPAKLRAAAARYRDVMEPLQKGLVERGLLAAAQEAKAPLVPYAVRHMGARYEKATERFYGSNGHEITTGQIREHMAAHGVPEPSYVTQAPGMRGAKNFYRSAGRPVSVGNKGPRTGSATLKGVFSAHPDVLVEGAARAQGLIDASDGFAATVNEFAHKPTLGKLKSHKAAENAARDLAATTGQAWRPVRIAPFAGKSGEVKALLDNVHGAGGIDEVVGGVQPVRAALESAVRGEPGEGPWALMPEPAAQRLESHLGKLGSTPAERGFQVVSSNFRRTVLSTSPSWAVGNVTEGLLRMGISRSGPLSYATGRAALRRLKELDPDAAHELSVRAVGGGHYHSASQLVHRDSTQFGDSRTLAPVARALGAFWRAPGPKQAAQVWHGWTDIVFRQLNGRLESQMQTAMLGRALRESPLMDGHLLKLSKDAVDQAARGLRDTNEQAAFADAVRRMYGQYDAFPPGTRWAIATYTPFVAWTLNALKFMGDTLPRDHPALLAAIAASETATDDWRKDRGMDLFIKDRLPGFLQGSTPTKGGGHQRAPFRYTPFGAFGDLPTTLAGAVLPQASGVLAAFKGEDWKGKKLTEKDGSPATIATQAQAAIVSFVDSTVPIVGVVKKAATGKSFNPFKPVAPKKAKLRPAGGAGSILGGAPSGGSDILSDGAPGGADTSGIFGP